MECYRCKTWPCTCKDGITLVHGDCRDVLVEFVGLVDLVVTDPPYKHAHMDGGGFAAASRFYAGGALEGLNDFNLDQYGDALVRVSPMLIAFHSRDLIGDYTQLARKWNRTHDLHVWHKVNAIPFTKNTWKSDLEYIALIWERKPGWRQMNQRMHSKCYSSALCTDTFHPACKPVELISKYLSILDPQSVLDPFAGSGSTLIAAKRLGRKAIGIELEERYCRIAANRLASEPRPLFT